MKKKNIVVANIIGAVGATLSVLSIAFFEAWKVSVTTLAAPLPVVERLPYILTGALIFYFFFWIFTKYFAALWSTVQIDIKLGVLVAIVVSFLEVIMLILDGSSDSMPWFRIFSHTFAQVIAFPIALVGLRYISEKKGVKKFLLQIGITVLMSIAITLIDYMPFVK